MTDESSVQQRPWDEWPVHWFEPGWSITRTVPPPDGRGRWGAVAEWSPGCLRRVGPTQAGRVPDFLIVGYGATETEAKRDALHKAGSLGTFNRIAEPDDLGPVS